MRSLSLLIFMLLSTSCLLIATVAAQEEASDIDKVLAELNAVSKKTPTCMVDENGLPKRVLICGNGAGMFAKPETGAEPLRNVGLFERLYLYVEGEPGGFHRVGIDPFGEEQTGWVPIAYCQIWDHNEMLFLNKDSVPDDTNPIHVWPPKDAAEDGNPEKAVYSEDVKGKGAFKDAFFPVLRKDSNLYEVAFVFGNDPGSRDQYGKKLTPSQQKKIVEQLSVVNVMIVIDATGSMVPYIEEAKAKAAEIADNLESTLLKSLTDEQIKLTVNVGLVAYRDVGDEFETNVFVPLTNDRSLIREKLRGLTANGGGDEPEMVVAALRLALRDESFTRGALNRIILIGDAPPHEDEGSILTAVGKASEAQFTQIDALICGDSKVTEETFQLIATASGGEVKKITAAEEVTQQIVNEVRARLKGLPIEKRLVDKSIAEKTSIHEAAVGLGITDERSIRQMYKFLVPRGAAVSSSGIDFQSGCIRARPGTAGRFRVHVYMPRWKLAAALARTIDLADEVQKDKRLAKTAPALVAEFLKLEGGENAMVGSDGTSAKERGKAIPELTPAIKAGEATARSQVKQYRLKMLELLKYWQNRDRWEHDHVWVPLDLIP